MLDFIYILPESQLATVGFNTWAANYSADPQMCHMAEKLSTLEISLIGVSLRIAKALACCSKQQHHEALLKLTHGEISQRNRWFIYLVDQQPLYINN